MSSVKSTLRAFSWAAAGMIFMSSAYAATDEKTLTLDSSGLQSMRIDAGAGFLHILGVAGAERIEVIANIETDSDDYRLSLTKEGNSAVLVSDTGRLPSLWFSARPRIDLTVTVPSTLLLDIEDGAGEIVLAGMNASAEVRDGSGSINIKAHRGNLEVHDGSGDISIADITGSVRIEDQSGDTAVVNTIGNVDIRDGSGPLRVQSVDGHVSIHDGSGSIVVTDVKQGLTVWERGSGGLTMTRIDKGVEIDD